MLLQIWKQNEDPSLDPQPAPNYELPYWTSFPGNPSATTTFKSPPVLFLDEGQWVLISFSPTLCHGVFCFSKETY